MAGELKRARATFERAIAYAKDVGLLSEEVDPAVTPPRLLEPLPPSGATPLRKCSTIRFAAYSGPGSCAWSKVSSRTCLPQSGRSSSVTLAAPGLGTALRLDLWRFTTASRQPGL
jgi:hypothetical protein